MERMEDRPRRSTQQERKVRDRKFHDRPGPGPPGSLGCISDPSTDQLLHQRTKVKM